MQLDADRKQQRQCRIASLVNKEDNEMKALKRSLSVMLVAVMMVAAMAIPAGAAVYTGSLSASKTTCNFPTTASEKHFKVWYNKSGTTGTFSFNTPTSTNGLTANGTATSGQQKLLYYYTNGAATVTLTFKSTGQLSGSFAVRVAATKALCGAW